MELLGKPKVEAKIPNVLDTDPDQDQGASINRVGEAELRVPAFAVDVVDTTGCGDAFDAGFMLTTAMGWEIDQAARFGAACGSLVATGLGSDAGIVDFDSTRAFMETSETIPLDD